MPFPQARAQGRGSVCMPWIVQGVWGPWRHSLSLLFCLMWFGNCHAFFLWFPQLFAKGNICWARAPVREPVRAYECVFSVERGLRYLHLFSSYPGGWEEWSSHNNDYHGERPCCLHWISASGDCPCTHSFSQHADIQGLQREMSTFLLLKGTLQKGIDGPWMCSPKIWQCGARSEQGVWMTSSEWRNAYLLLYLRFYMYSVWKNNKCPAIRSEG